MNLFQTKTVGEVIDDLGRLVSPIKTMVRTGQKRLAGESIRALIPYNGRAISRRKREATRNYAAAESSSLFKDWPTSGGTADAEIYPYLRALRVRSRHLAKNNDYAKRFFNILKQNVVGPDGIGLQARGKDESGEMDKTDNDYLESQWKEWGKKGVCTVDGKLSFNDCQKLFIETIARDGECIVRKIRNWPGNRFGFALQFIEPDYLDHELNKTLSNGNTIRLGIEFNKWRRPVAYYLKKISSQISIYGESADYLTGRHERIPASEVIHEFVIERIGQSRGVPWLHTAARRLQMLGGYEEAELVASRTAAAKMGFFTSKTGDEYVGDEDEAGEPTETPVMDATPGTFEELPEGLDFVKWDPDHPVSAFEQFVLAILRGVASGLNISYVTLANDLRSVNYSSIRQGALDDRDAWRALQGWLIEHLLNEVYFEWLSMAITNPNGLNLPPRKINKYLDIVWRPRGWQWVDPLKEGRANERDVQNGFKSPQEVAGAQGRDYDEVLQQIKDAKELAQSYGLDLNIFNKPKGGQNAGANPNN